MKKAERILFWRLIGLVECGYSTYLLAQETRILPPAQEVPLHSTVDVSSLRSPSLVMSEEKAAVRVKPFLRPDAEGLRQWKEFIHKTPESLPTDAGAVTDTTPEVVTPSPLAPSVSTQFEGLNNSNNVAITGFSA